jgi:hypothetical protein
MVSRKMIEEAIIQELGKSGHSIQYRNPNAPTLETNPVPQVRFNVRLLNLILWSYRPNSRNADSCTRDNAPSVTTEARNRQKRFAPPLYLPVPIDGALIPERTNRNSTRVMKF